MLRVAQLPLGAYQTNCYLVAREGSREAVVIDPGDTPERVLETLALQGLDATAILVTHGHFDHLGGVRGIAEATGVQVWMPAGDADALRTLAAESYEPDHLLNGGETVSVGGIDFDTLSVPGHTAASIAYHADGCLFSGDVLFQGSVGRTDLDGGDMDTLVDSIERLISAYPADTVVCSGHGPTTTLGRELAANPFLAGLRA